jgi:hypothetical protein
VVAQLERATRASGRSAATANQQLQDLREANLCLVHIWRLFKRMKVRGSFNMVEVGRGFGLITFEDCYSAVKIDGRTTNHSNGGVFAMQLKH